MEIFSTNVCVCGVLYLFIFFLADFFWLVFLFGFLGGVVWGFFLYIFSLFSADSIFFELLKICRPQIAFYSTKMPNPVP